MGARSQTAAVSERANATRASVRKQVSHPLDAETGQLVRAVKSRLQELYGSRLKGVILFGSRARGDFHEASDVDVAIVLDQPVEHPFALKCQVIDTTYDLFLDSGMIIQPWPLCEAWLDAPQASPWRHVVRAVLREGIRV